MFNLPSFSGLEKTLMSALGLILVLVGLVLYGEHRQAVKQDLQWSAAVKAKQDELDNAKKVGITLAKQLTAAKAKSTIVYKVIVHYIPKQEIVYVNQKPVQSGPITVSLNDLFVWNSATQGDTRLPSAAFGIAGSPADSGVTLQAILGNYAGNAAICQSTTRQLQALIEWERAAHPKQP